MWQKEQWGPHKAPAKGEGLHRAVGMGEECGTLAWEERETGEHTEPWLANGGHTATGMKDG